MLGRKAARHQPCQLSLCSNGTADGAVPRSLFYTLSRTLSPIEPVWYYKSQTATRLGGGSFNVTPMNHIASQTTDCWHRALIPPAANHEPCHASETETMIESEVSADKNYRDRPPIDAAPIDGSDLRCSLRPPAKGNIMALCCHHRGRRPARPLGPAEPP